MKKEEFTEELILQLWRLSY